MNEDQKDVIMQKIVSGEKEVSKLLRHRKNAFLRKSVKRSEVDDYYQDGWEEDKPFINTVRIKKAKSADEQFEDYVWSLFARLGFKFLNRDRSLRVPYEEGGTCTQQLDVLAVDNECILVVECKAAVGEPKRGNFKTAIEAIEGRRKGLITSLKKLFPNKKYKVKFILATHRYFLSEPDRERLAQYDIDHFEYGIVEYYHELVTHLGHAARYQLLGSLFQGLEIPALETRVPAIQGKMGGNTYYSFSIEPERLLKLGYVLHRNKANSHLMPTYQRIIKKSRLKSVQEFVNDGGFFPNSLIINIESKRKLNFEASGSKV